MAELIEWFYHVGETLIGLQSFPVMVVYLILVALSPFYQRITNPYSLRQTMVVYNFTCSFISACTMLGAMAGMIAAGSIFQKESNDLLKNSFFLYWCSKHLELLDTLFMILRHRSRQISFLHVYHHASMVLLSDFGYHHFPTPGVAFGLSINAFVHVCLYYYYGYTAQRPLSGAPSWKRHLTEIQITQFVVDLVHAVIGYLFHGFCVYCLMYGATMLYLFSSFYYNAYVKKRKGE
nr:elongation of very long chain fatty acids protein 5-like [Lytechinus pictus]